MTWQPDYVTVADLAQYLRIGDDLDDGLLATAITSASRAVDRWCHRQFGSVGVTAQERTYCTRINHRRRVWVADIDDLMTVTDLVVEADGTVTTDYTLEPRNAAQELRPWTRLVLPSCAQEVAVTARWGWTTIPAAVVEATLLQASRLFVRRNAPFGVAGSPQEGSEIRLLSRLDPDVAVVLSGYRRLGAVG